MKKIASYIAVVLLTAAASSFATIKLTAPATPPDFVKIKDTPASRAMNEAAKDLSARIAAAKADADQAQAKLAADQKDNLAAASALQKEMSDLLKADPKYKTYVDRMDALNKSLSDSKDAAQNAFDARHKADKDAEAKDAQTIQGVFKVVQQENKLPDTASYDPSTQTWSLKTPTK